MTDSDYRVEALKALLETLARTFEETLSRIDASRENTGGLKEGPVGGDQTSYPKGAGTGEQAGSASGRRCGAIIDSVLLAVGEAATARGSDTAIGSREISSIKTAVE